MITSDEEIDYKKEKVLNASLRIIMQQISLGYDEWLIIKEHFSYIYDIAKFRGEHEKIKKQTKLNP